MNAPSAPLQPPPRTQNPCCYTAAMEDEATYCGDCGKPLIRCMAFEECGGLLDDRGLCTVCIAPRLQVDAGALTTARIGGAVALPVSITNLSAVGRPLHVTSVWSREGTELWQEERLAWERLSAGEERPITIRADSLERAGLHDIEILIGVASRWRWREERYAFTATVSLEIEGDEKESGPVVNIGGDTAGHGNTVYIAGKTDAELKSTRSDQAIPLKAVRAEKEERALGLRGMDDALWTPRGVQLLWRGFPDTDTPLEGPILTMDGILAVGRSRSRRDGGPGDVRILPETADGAVDEAASQALSRRHFELYIECDRLVLRVTGSNGVRVNGEAYGRDKTIPLSDGDTIAPVVHAPDAFGLTTRFQTEHGRVSAKTFERTPPSARRGG